MKVIFLEDVAGTADAGEVKQVKNGFARNYLLPKKLAAPATADALQRINAIEAAAKEKRVKYSKEWAEVAEAMNGTQVTIEMRVGPTGRLFGAVTGRHIAEHLTRDTGREIDHRQVLLGESIHEPGDFEIAIRLYRDVHARVNVSVVPEGLTPEEAAAMRRIEEEERNRFETGATAEATEGEAEAESAEATSEETEKEGT